MHGHGVYTWADGRRYEGQYEMDKKHGFGVYRWADGRVYEGNWYNGKQHGQGKYILLDNTVKVGEWVNGKRTHWIDSNTASNRLEPGMPMTKGNPQYQQQMMH